MGLQALLQKIAEVQDATPKERTLARYLEREYSTLAFDNLESLSAKAGVSKSTISRFMGKLGYDNFRLFLQELRRVAVNEQDTPIKRYSQRSQRPSSAIGMLHEHLEGVGENMRQTGKKIRGEEYEKALDLLCDESRPLFIMGCAASAHLLGYFYVLMHYLRQNITLLNADTPEIARAVAQTKPDAVLFAMTYKRYANPTLRLLRFFKEKGHETILLTDSYSAQALQNATIPLVVHTEGPNMFYTRCSALAVMEALLAGMVPRLAKRVPDRYAAIDELMTLFEVYPPR